MNVQSRFFAVGMALLLCSCYSAEHRGNAAKGGHAAPIRVACVGDSITYGFRIQNRDQNSYPAQLGRCLANGWEVKNFGTNGATLLRKGTKPYWSQVIFDEAQKFKPDVVIIMLGTNDTKQENWGTHGSEFMSDYLALIRKFRDLNNRSRIYLCLPPPLFRDRGHSVDTDKILHDEIIPSINQVARRAHLPVIDFYATFENKAELFPDLVHPNAAGAGIIARSVCKTLIAE